MRAWLFAIVVVAVISFGAGHATAHTHTTTPRATQPVVRHLVASRRATVRTRPRVTVIGDSVADEINYLASAQAALGRGVRLNLQLAACRRLVESSCTVGGVQPTTVLELVSSLGRSLGPVVVVAVGYNDYSLVYPRDVRSVLRALRRAGVQHVLWLTLRATRHDYLAMNDTLRTIASTEPQLTVVDWNVYSRSHPDWFDSDGLHLTPAGGEAMARLVHQRLVAMRIAVS